MPAACTGCSGGLPAPCGSPPSCVCHKPRRKGVLLLNLGTPDAPTKAAVRRYLAEFLADPFVIKLPGKAAWATPALAKTIALFRAKGSAANYARIWTERGSPLKFHTEDQVAALGKVLGSDWQVFYAMRYANPNAAQVLGEIERAGITDLVVVPMYPQFGGPTTGTALADLYAQMAKQGLRLNVTVRTTWYDDAGYIDAQARMIAERAEAEGLTPENCYLLHSTHSMPASYIADGDPYEGQVRRSVELVNRRLGWPTDRTSLSFQSKLGPVPWLGPQTDATLEDLAERGERNVLVCPISFTADCLETVDELGREYRELFHEKTEGEGKIHLLPAPNAYGPFIHAVAQIVRRGPVPVDVSKPAEPLMDFGPSGDDFATLIGRLVMAGVSVAGRTLPEGGPALSHVGEDALKRVKVPAGESVGLLKTLGDLEGVGEAMLWNTCCRFEAYALADDESDADQMAADLQRAVARGEVDESAVNLLRGAEAWHHLLRTAAGLNSTLPGDGSILEQLDSAARMAAHAGVGGPGVKRLVAGATTLIKQLRDTTEWGNYAADYATAAFGRHAKSAGKTFADASCVVIGGSTTSRAMLRLLVDDLDVPQKNLTVIYRGEGRERLVKVLRKIIGHGRRLRVDDYGDPAVAAALAEADFLFLGIDRRGPILQRRDVEQLRDFKRRPLTVVDFNSFGSTEGLADIPGVRVLDADHLDDEVSAHAARLAKDPKFALARRFAEAFLDGEVSSLRGTPKPTVRRAKAAAGKLGGRLEVLEAVGH